MLTGWVCAGCENVDMVIVWEWSGIVFFFEFFLALFACVCLLSYPTGFVRCVMRRFERNKEGLCCGNDSGGVGRRVGGGGGVWWSGAGGEGE